MLYLSNAPLKGLTMIFAGQENPSEVRKYKYISKQITKSLKICWNCEEKQGFLASFILEGTLTEFLISYNFYYVWCVWKKRKMIS